MSRAHSDQHGWREAYDEPVLRDASQCRPSTLIIGWACICCTVESKRLVSHHESSTSTVILPLLFPFVPVAQFALRFRCLRARDACSVLSDFSTICCKHQPIRVTLFSRICNEAQLCRCATAYHSCFAFCNQRLLKVLQDILLLQGELLQLLADQRLDPLHNFHIILCHQRY